MRWDPALPTFLSAEKAKPFVFSRIACIAAGGRGHPAIRFVRMLHGAGILLFEYARESVLSRFSSLLSGLQISFLCLSPFFFLCVLSASVVNNSPASCLLTPVPHLLKGFSPTNTILKDFSLNSSPSSFPYLPTILNPVLRNSDSSSG